MICTINCIDIHWTCNALFFLSSTPNYFLFPSFSAFIEPTVSRQTELLHISKPVCFFLLSGMSSFSIVLPWVSPYLSDKRCFLQVPSASPKPGAGVSTRQGHRGTVVGEASETQSGLVVCSASESECARIRIKIHRSHSQLKATAEQLLPRGQRTAVQKPVLSAVEGPGQANVSSLLASVEEQP